MRSPAFRANTGISIDVNDPVLELYLPLWYPDAETTGSTIISKDINRHSCTRTGGTWGTNGITMDGDDYINIDSVLTQLSATAVGSIFMWVNMPDATPAAQNCLVAFGNTEGATLSIIRVKIETTGVLTCEAYNEGVLEWKLAADAAVVSDNTWTLLGLVQNGTSPVIYKDGVAPAQTFATETDKTYWFSKIAAIDNGRIGSRNVQGLGNGLFLTGTVANVIIRSGALSAVEVLSLKTNTERGYPL